MRFGYDHKNCFILRTLRLVYSGTVGQSYVAKVIGIVFLRDAVVVELNIREVGDGVWIIRITSARDFPNVADITVLRTFG